MKGVFPLLALALLGGAAPCGTSRPVTAGTYGYLPGGVPPPAESVRWDGKTVTVTQSLGDRMFTDITSTYDAKTLALLSLKRNADCCGAFWSSTVTRNADGTYDVEAQMALSRDDVYKESRPHLRVQPNAFLNAGGFFFIPFLYHATRDTGVVQLTFSPIQTDYLRISETSAQPYPDNVPARDQALLLTPASGGPATTLWYDPCTFTLDAYGERGGAVRVRTALL